MALLLRVLISAWILFTLARAGRAAWAQRPLMLAIWRSIRPRHVVGCLGLLVAVGSVAVALTQLPLLAFGLGDLIDFDGNAVFVPLDEAAQATAPTTPGGVNWGLLALSTLFLGGLALLLPWLAFIEEEVFRAGIEDASLGRELLAALVFGAAHLVMLVPLSAALAIGVGGFVYGRLYRAGVRDGAAGRLVAPEPLRRAYRPTKRAKAALGRATQRRLEGAPATTEAAAELGVLTEVSAGIAREALDAQVAGVWRSTVWHTTFNTMVVVLVWLAYAASAVFEA